MGLKSQALTLVLSFSTAMADATRSKANVDRWEDAFAKLSSSMTSKIDELLHRMNQLETSHANPHVPSAFSGPSSTTTADFAYQLKLEVPRFNGSDPKGWIFNITQFFEYHATRDHDRLTIASFYMEGPAHNSHLQLMRILLVYFVN